MIDLHNLELECHVLMSLIDVNTVFDKYHSQLHANLFFFSQNQQIFNAIVRIKTETPTQPLDIVLVRDELQRSNQLEVIGGEKYLENLMNVVGLSNIDSAVARLQEYHALRTINEASKTAIAQALNGDKAEDITNRLVETVTDTQRSHSKVAIHTPNDLLAGMVEKVQSYMMKGSPFISVGFTELDFKLGLSAGNLMVLAARPSMGKTALAMNMVTTIAKNAPGKTALVFSLEMGADDIMNRLVSAEGEVHLSVIRGGLPSSDEHWANIANAVAKINPLPLAIIDKPAMTIQEIRTECQRVKRETKKPLSVIMVDYLQIMGGLNGDNKIDKISYATMQLKGLGKEHNCPVILLSQLNRGLESRPDKRPINSDLRDSGTIEQDADIIAMIYRDEYYHKDKNDNKGMAEVIITKNRNGATGTVGLGFQGQYSRFVDYIPQMQDENPFLEAR